MVVVTDENSAVDVVTRLARQFPHIARADIANLVADVQSTFDQARVRSFVPILVERSVSEQLRVRYRATG